MKRRSAFVSFIKAIVLMQFFFLALLAGLSWDINSNLEYSRNLRIPETYMSLFKVKISREMAQSALRLNNVAMAGINSPQLAWRDYLNRRMPQAVMSSNLRVLASRGAYSADLPDDKPVINNPLENAPPETQPYNEKYAAALKECQVVFYCTHSAESYIPDSGVAKCEGQRGLVNQVADTLARELNRAGIQAVFNDTIHDFPEYNYSYTNSRETVKNTIKKYPHLVALFDIHRDSIPGREDAETINVNGKDAALILIVVGTDERKPHPNWRKNLAFAEKIRNKGEEIYPGLIKGVRSKAGTYNQEFFDHALLLEFGTDRNSLQEVTYAAQLFTNILLDVLYEEVSS